VLKLKALKHLHTYRRLKRQSKAAVSQFSSLPGGAQVLLSRKGQVPPVHAYMGAHATCGDLLIEKIKNIFNGARDTEINMNMIFVQEECS